MVEGGGVKKAFSFPLFGLIIKANNYFPKV